MSPRLGIRLSRFDDPKHVIQPKRTKAKHYVVIGDHDKCNGLGLTCCAGMWYTVGPPREITFSRDTAGMFSGERGSLTSLSRDTTHAGTRVGRSRDTAKIDGSTLKGGLQSETAHDPPRTSGAARSSGVL